MLKSSVRSFLNKLTTSATRQESIVEGLYADQHSLAAQCQIKQEYTRRWSVEKTPLTNPESYDPLQPPPGWRYDPYYECWINTGDSK